MALSKAEIFSNAALAANEVVKIKAELVKQEADIASTKALLVSAEKKAASEESKVKALFVPNDHSVRPDMPPEVELDEDFCHARIGVKLAKEDIVDADKDDWLGRELGLKFGGFPSKIYLETQCTNKSSKGEILCSGCQKNFAKHDVAKWTAWKGLIGEAPPPKCRFIRSEYSTKVYAAWGEAPRSGPSSAKKPIVQKQPNLDIIEPE